MRTLILFVAIAAAGFAQVESNGLTVTVSRPMSVPPDQASVGIYLTSGTDSVLDDVLAALQSAKIAATDLSSVTQYQTVSPSLVWAFTRTVPFADLTATLSALSTTQQNLTKQKVAMSLSFYVQATSYSTQLAAAQPCPYGALVSDAHTQAQKVAGAAGVSLGAITAMTQGDGTAGAAIPTYAYVSGDFAVLLAGVVTNPFPATGLVGNPALYFSPGLIISRSACTLTVQFKLGQ